MIEKAPLLFDQWNKEKKCIHCDGATGHRGAFYINAKEIRYVKLGINVGYEQDGILDRQKNQGNEVVLEARVIPTTGETVSTNEVK